jgi:hypothetical protein
VEVALRFAELALAPALEADHLSLESVADRLGADPAGQSSEMIRSQLWRGSLFIRHGNIVERGRIVLRELTQLPVRRYSARAVAVVDECHGYGESGSPILVGNRDPVWALLPLLVSEVLSMNWPALLRSA